MKASLKEKPAIEGESRWLRSALALLAVGIAAVGVAVGMRGSSAYKPENAIRALPNLLAAGDRDLAAISIERMNLICSQGLGTEGPEIEQLIATLETWADRVRTETERHRYRFERNPAEFDASQGFFQMLMLAVVLNEDFHIHYDSERRNGPTGASVGDGFFARPADVFLHGLLGPGRQGTCSSLPVLYVAIGRHLGYPLKLVTTKGHLFVRWEDAEERFNVEVTGRGISRFSDEYYRHWPFEVSRAEEITEGYLKSLSPAEELAAFLSIRGMCLREAGRMPEAAESFAHAARLAPRCASYHRVRAHLQRGLGMSEQND